MKGLNRIAKVLCKQWDTLGRRIAAGALLFAAAGAAAEPRTIDRIAAVVDDGVVMESEVLERYRSIAERIQAEGGQVPPRDAVMEQVLERLIVENLQLQQAEGRGIVVDDETLTRAVTEFAGQNGLTIDAFIVQMQAEGISYREFRDQVRRQLTIERVQREVVNRRVYITEQDIEELIASPFFAEQISDEYRLGHILLSVPTSASRAAVAETRRRAEALVAELRDGGDFRTLAIENSQASTALEGGDLGWRKASRLPGLLAEHVTELAVGEVAGPIQNASGFHIVMLLDKRGASQQTASEALVRHILVQPSAIRTDAEAQALVQSLRERIAAGEDFAELAREHSEDPGSGLAGGDLGWTTGEAFVPEFRAAMEATATGELSDAFRSPFGWHVLEVRDRREQDASDEARRDYATRVLHAQRFDERLQEWLTEIRDEAYVDRRIAGGGTP